MRGVNRNLFRAQEYKVIGLTQPMTRIVAESWMLFSKSTANIGQLQSPGEWRPRDRDTRCQCQVSGRAGPVSGAPGMVRVERVRRVFI